MTENSAQNQPDWTSSYKNIVQEDGPRDNSHGKIQGSSRANVIGMLGKVEVSGPVQKAVERVKAFLKRQNTNFTDPSKKHAVE